MSRVEDITEQFKNTFISNTHGFNINGHSSDGNCAKLKHFLRQRDILLKNGKLGNELLKRSYVVDFYDILNNTSKLPIHWSRTLGIPETKEIFSNNESIELTGSTNEDLGNVQAKCIGEGACGLVYKISSNNIANCANSTVFAVKRFSPRVLNEDVQYFYEKIIIEYEIGKILSNCHLNFIKIYGLYVDQYGSHTSEKYSTEDEYHHELMKFPKFSMAMEYGQMEFIDLVLQEKNTLTDHEIHCYFKQIVNAVAFMHNECNMVHRDLKLDNCVIIKPGVLKLIDFGSTILLDHEDQSLNTVVGSDPYLAPEILVASQYMAKPVDIWSIAIIYYCMIMKSFPWRAPRMEDVSFKLFSWNSRVDFEDSDENYDNFHNDLDDTESEKEDEEEEEEEEDYNNFNDDMMDTDEEETVSNTFTNRGPMRVLKHFDLQIRGLLRGMFTIDPKKRYTVTDILNDPCFQSIECCFEKPSDVEEYYLHHKNKHFIE
ncbi:hypothetical protein ACO0QE_001444 [Hanseniaspora vineae]